MTRSTISPSHSAVHRPFQKVSLPGLAMELVAIHEHAAAGKHHVGHAFDIDAFKHGVIHAHVVGLGADGVLAVGVKDHKIGVTANSHGAFLRVETEDPGRSRGYQLDKAVHAEASFAHAARIDQAHAVLDSGAAVGNFGEVVFAHFFLFFEAERAMVGGD